MFHDPENEEKPCIIYVMLDFLMAQKIMRLEENSGGIIILDEEEEEEEVLLENSKKELEREKSFSDKT